MMDKASFARGSWGIAEERSVLKLTQLYQVLPRHMP